MGGKVLSMTTPSSSGLSVEKFANLMSDIGINSSGVNISTFSQEYNAIWSNEYANPSEFVRSDNAGASETDLEEYSESQNELDESFKDGGNW